MCLDVKIQQTRYDWYISKWKCNKWSVNHDMIVVFRAENSTSKVKLSCLKVKMRHVA